MTSWFHFDCFFERQRPKAVGDVDNFDKLRYEDQERIKEKIKTLSEQGTLVVEKKGRGKGKAASAKGKGKVLLPDYTVGYAKSNRSTCRGCMEGIAKDEVRISKKSFDDEKAIRSGQPMDAWYHVQCFKERREELGFTEGIDLASGFDDLTAGDKKKLQKDLPALANKKHKLEDTVDGDGPSGTKKVKREQEAPSKEEEETKKQNKILYKYRDDLEQELSKAELQQLLEFNDQDVPSGKDAMLDHLADVMTFGSLERCPECKKGQFYYKSGVGYVCHGNMSEWTKCPNTTTDPARRPFKIPKEFVETYSFLKKYKFVARKRVVPKLQVSEKPPKKEDTKTEIKSEKKPAANRPPLKGLSIYVDDKLNRKDDAKKLIEKLGGKASSRISSKLSAIMSTKSQLESMGSKMDKAAEYGIPVFPLDVLEDLNEDSSLNVTYIISKNIATWDCPNINDRLGVVETDRKSSANGSKKSGKSEKSMPEKLRLTLKGGGVVDPESGLEDKAHVLKLKDTLYSVVLGIVDIQQDRNSYYKLQVLEHDKKDKWFLFRSWGRVGTTIGDSKLSKMSEKEEAIEEFVRLYEEKTGNAWKNRKHFVKQPGKLYPLDIDYGDAGSATKLSSETSKSKLPAPIKDLVCMLFDVEAMKRAMVEFELDLTKMPLGKLSQKQLAKAYGILNDAQQLLNASEKNEAKFVDVSNQFYTLIPHDFGRNSPPLLDNAELIKTKLEMLESLMEIEIAFNLLKEGDAVKDKDPIDAHYEKLKTEIEVLDKSSQEYALLQEYVKNTHASTHTQYSLDIEEIFKVVRKGEAKRFKPFSKLHNRQLLWHGSRVANMAGILSQGLRIAPPEAPVTGYMFGKGIYFADMVSKSANYCVTSKKNPIGLMLLCDVALGNCYERSEADYIEKLKKDYQSVKGVGKTQPNPEESKSLDSVQIPLGKPITNKKAKGSLLYNEYIVYDVAQVNIKYLFKMKFNYK